MKKHMVLAATLAIAACQAAPTAPVPHGPRLSAAEARAFTGADRQPIDYTVPPPMSETEAVARTQDEFARVDQARAQCAYEAEAATAGMRGILLPSFESANLRNLCMRARGL